MRPGQSKSPVELRVITQAHWAFVWTPDGATALILATYPHGPYCQRAQAFAERMERRARYPKRGTSYLGRDVSHVRGVPAGPSGRARHDGMSARGQLTGRGTPAGVRSLEHARTGRDAGCALVLGASACAYGLRCCLSFALRR